jgi:probable rRNA maturation factor
VAIEVEVEDGAWAEALADPERLAMAAAKAALGPMAADRDVVILLTDDAAVQDLNARFRHKDAPTNVLAFPAPEASAGHLGDLALAFGVCAREAAEQAKPLAHHLQHLVAHGTLHLLGYDHQRDDEAEAMEAEERRILQGLGVPDPYA